MKLHRLACGWLTGPMQGFLQGVEGRLRVPVPAWLVEHPQGTVLFDAGMHPDVASDPAGRLGPLATIFEADYGADETCAARLAQRDFDPARIDWLVASHFHFDHAGGFESVPNARLVVQRKEWQAAADPDLAARNGFDPKDWDHGHDRLLVDGEYDLFGDGRVVCLPSHGHTPGHQSLRVRLDDGEYVLTADACYLRRTLDDLHLPGVVYDPEQMRATLQRFRALEAAGATLLFGHDPDQFAALPDVLGR